MDLLKGLNKEQKKAVIHSDGPLLVLAGAGTGKTKVITHRIARLIRSGLNPDKILAVTFTNKAAQEMKERVANLLENNQSPANPTIGTFHGISADILRKHGESIGIPRNFSIVNEKEGWRIVKSVIEELELNQKQFRPSSIQNMISKQKSSNYESPTSTDDFFLKNLSSIQQKYCEQLKKGNSLDFDDLIQKTVVLFEEKPEILQIYQEKWPYIHIDEYQDTDLIQSKLIKILARKYSNICAVGDEDQSIYGFRGADLSNILEFEKNWPGAKSVILEKNYRSTQRILDAANAIIAKNSLRREKKLYSRDKKGFRLIISEFKNEKEEARFIAEKIKNILSKTLINPVAVLCRANFQFSPFEEIFSEYRIPYQTAADQDSLDGKTPVQLMTVHAAKGLEFGHVFIPGLEKGLFPYSAASKSNSGSEEERRLFYVALTRAREKIYLSYSQFRNAFGAKQINQPSQFLSDIPQNLLKWL